MNQREGVEWGGRGRRKGGGVEGGGSKGGRSWQRRERQGGGGTSQIFTRRAPVPKSNPSWLPSWIQF